MTSPYTGANSPLFYCEEVTPGVLNASPVWLPFRTNSGMPVISRDITESNELDSTRDSSSPRLGNKQVQGEMAYEITPSSQDDVLAGAMMSDWVDGESEAGLNVTVDSAAKTFTRDAGDFTTKVQVGDFIAFPTLTGDNAKPFFVTSVSALVVTGADNYFELSDEVAASASYKTANSLQVGSACKTYSILTILNGLCGGTTEYLLTTGVRFIGFNVEAAVNSMITGSSAIIGTKQIILDSLPSGSTFPVIEKVERFHSIDASVSESSDRLMLIDNFTITNDNAASAQFELGNEYVAFVEVGKASNTFTASGKVASLDLYKMSLNDEVGTFKLVLSNSDGALAFKLNNSTFSVNPERGGPESITQSIDGRAAMTNTESSLVIYRIVY